MKGYEIRQLMHDHKVQAKHIADDLKVKRPMVSMVIHGVRSNPRIRQAIAKAVNKPISDLWPEQDASPLA